MYDTCLLARAEVKQVTYACCGSADSGRSFLTKEEKIELLEEYKERLEKEAKGVEERIKELKKNN